MSPVNFATAESCSLLGSPIGSSPKPHTMFSRSVLSNPRISCLVPDAVVVMSTRSMFKSPYVTLPA